jgi:hypothetical protein
MKPQALNLRIGRLLIDAEVADGVRLDALADAVRSELALRMQDRPAGPLAASPHLPATTPIAGAIADRIAGRLGTMNTGIALKTAGGGDGAH